MNTKFPWLNKFLSLLNIRMLIPIHGFSIGTNSKRSYRQIVKAIKN